jgi:hypothetical protein
MIDDPPARVSLAPDESSARIGVIVLGSRAPLGAVAWYRRALGLPSRDDVLQAGDVELRITSLTDGAPNAVEPIRLILNFIVEDIQAIEARLVAMDAVWVRELERTPWGIIGTVLDADGNYVQIIEPKGGTLRSCAKCR